VGVGVVSSVANLWAGVVRTKFRSDRVAGGRGWSVLVALLPFLAVPGCGPPPPPTPLEESLFADPGVNPAVNPGYNPNLDTRPPRATGKPVAPDGDWLVHLRALDGTRISPEVTDPDRLRLRLNAARDGDPKAQYQVAVMFATGTGTSPNAVEAYFWASLACANGYADANALRDDTASALTLEQQQQVRVRVNEWLTRARAP